VRKGIVEKFKQSMCKEDTSQLKKKGGGVNMVNMSCHHGLAQYKRNIPYQGQTLGYNRD